MKNVMKMCMLLLVAVAFAGCDQIKGLMGGGNAYEVDAIAFQEEDGGKWGLMTLDGEVVVKPKFELQPTSSMNGRFFVPDYSDGKFTLYTTEMKPKKLGEFRDVGMFMEDLCPVVDKNGKAKYIDKDGKKAFDVKKIGGKEVVTLNNFTEGLAMVTLDNGKSGYINKKGENVIPCKYYDAWMFMEGLAVVAMTDEGTQTGKWGAIDKDGEVVFQKKGKDIHPYNNYYSGGYLVAVDKNERYCLLDKKGEVKLKLKKDQSVSGNVIDDKFVFYDGSKYGLMDVNGETLIRAKYSSMYYNGKFIVATTDGDKYNLLTAEGEKIARLPDGYPSLFEKENKGYDAHFVMYNWGKDNVLVDKEGNEVEIDHDLYDTSNTIYYSCSTTFNNPDYEDYDDYDIDYD